jgi:hypothetical protein
MSARDLTIDQVDCDCEEVNSPLRLTEYAALENTREDQKWRPSFNHCVGRNEVDTGAGYPDPNGG